jgi:hypothetical protein
MANDKAGYSQMLNSGQNEEECDPNNSVGASATDDDSSTKAGPKKINISNYK